MLAMIGFILAQSSIYFLSPLGSVFEDSIVSPSAMIGKCPRSPKSEWFTKNLFLFICVSKHRYQVVLVSHQLNLPLRSGVAVAH
jgi:hypothetical protein